MSLEAHHEELRTLLAEVKHDSEFENRMAEIRERKRAKPQTPGFTAEEAEKIFAAFL